MGLPCYSNRVIAAPRLSWAQFEDQYTVVVYRKRLPMTFPFTFSAQAMAAIQEAPKLAGGRGA